jgi:hypothetical protein
MFLNEKLKKKIIYIILIILTKKKKIMFLNFIKNKLGINMNFEDFIGDYKYEVDKSFINNKDFINIKITNISSYYENKNDISKILYYNNLKYKTKRYHNKIILQIFNNIKLNKLKYSYNDFYLTDLYKILNIQVLDSNEYLLQINRKLNNINFNTINLHE